MLSRLLRLHWDTLTLATPVLYTLRTRAPPGSGATGEGAAPAAHAEAVALAAGDEAAGAQGGATAASTAAAAAAAAGDVGPALASSAHGSGVRGTGLIHMEKNWVRTG